MSLVLLSFRDTNANSNGDTKSLCSVCGAGFRTAEGRSSWCSRLSAFKAPNWQIYLFNQTHWYEAKHKAHPIFLGESQPFLVVPVWYRGTREVHHPAHLTLCSLCGTLVEWSTPNHPTAPYRFAVTLRHWRTWASGSLGALESQSWYDITLPMKWWIIDFVNISNNRQEQHLQTYMTCCIWGTKLSRWGKW